MKVLGISGSARKNGNTAIIMNIVLSEVKQAGIETELIQLGNDIIAPCRGCFSCKGKKNCIFQKDKFCGYFEKMVEADGILLGSPVYSADVSANMKAYLERAGVIVATNPGLLKYKVGAAVSAVRRGGGLAAVDTMNHFFLNKEVVLAGSTYWNMVYGKDVGDVQSDMEGIENMKNLGQNMAWLIKKLC
ncbi:flavodoxin family protein [Enterocloster sp. OA13]|uniref:flavodoxin family protein n=1 Tax=Enterocloster sp. OA13 TaxID=2914161 RepID=UPI00046F8EE7|nr:flavodoxin family protein [Enterocloster sp. OA13]